MMPVQLATHRDVFRYVAGRAAVTLLLTVLMSATAAMLQFGADLSAMVPVGRVLIFVVVSSAAVSTLLSGALSYRSALLLRQLTLAEAELKRLARTDPLTGLLNRRGFDEAAAAALQLAYPDNREVVALMADIDCFKSINDRFGHEFGDRVITELGDILRRFGAEHDVLIARHGGEEFAALFVGVDAEQAVAHAETLRELCHLDMIQADATVRVSLSFGLTAHVGETDLSAIMRWADRALYQAKERGRDRVVRAEGSSFAA